MVKKSSKKKDLIFVISVGRSGSTVLAKFLGMHSRILALSEPSLFEYEIGENKFCSCEKPYSDCPFWRKIIDKLNIDIKKFTTRSVAFSSDFWGEKLIKYINLYFFNRFGIPYLFTKYLKQIKNEAHILKTIAQETKENVIVDSSKIFSRALFLERVLKKDFNCHYIILIRDPRANVASHMKKVSQVIFSETNDTKQKSGMDINTALERWVNINKNLLRFNIIFRKEAKIIFYEDFASNPKKIFNQIFAKFGLDWEAKMLNLNSKDHHLMGGNRSRITANTIHPPKEDWKLLTSDQLEIINKRSGTVLNLFK